MAQKIAFQRSLIKQYDGPTSGCLSVSFGVP